MKVAYTIKGDANLDFVCDGADLNTVLSNYNTRATGRRRLQRRRRRRWQRLEHRAVELQPGRRGCRLRAGTQHAVAGRRRPARPAGLRLEETQIDNRRSGIPYLT